jgi:hypothetical protein
MLPRTILNTDRHALWKTLAIAVVLRLLASTCSTTAHAARPQKPAAPEIFSLNPSEGPAGTPIKITGTGFERTKYVLFAAGRTGQQAKFKVLSDTELEVTAPTWLQPGTTATPIVVGPNGATVGMPASVLEVDHRRRGGNNEATFYRVSSGGMLESTSQGIIFVEDGGVADAPQKSIICFVKKGGTLLHADRFPGLAIYEPGANFETGPQPYNPSTRLMRVPTITISVGVEPFVYVRSDSAVAVAESPPEVQSIGPAKVPIGGVLTLKGKGFAETNEVLFLPGESAKTVLPAEFQIVSDAELNVQVPETLESGARLVIINPLGATLVAAQNDVRAFRRPPETRKSGRRTAAKNVSRVRASANPVTVVGNGGFVKDSGMQGVYFVEEGGRVIHTGGSCVYFVKNGGKVEGSGGRVFIVRELQGEASIGSARNRTETDRDAPALSLSVVPTTFVVVPP